MFSGDSSTPTSNPQASQSAGGGVTGWMVGLVQSLFGKHGAGSLAGRAMQQIAYATYRMQQQQAAQARRQFDQWLEASNATGTGSGFDLVPIKIPDPLPVRLSSALTHAQQIKNPVAQAHNVARAEKRITRYQQSHPDAFTYRYVTAHT
jgi:hypothetical protein